MVIRPTFAPVPVNIVLVATVVPCITDVILDGSTFAFLQTRFIPLNTPIDESSGVLGTLAVHIVPVFSLMRRRSVKVPPTSTPSR